MKCHMCKLRVRRFPKRFSSKNIEYASKKCDLCLRPFCKYDLWGISRNNKMRTPISILCFECIWKVGFGIVYSFIKSNSLNKKHVTALKRMVKEYEKQNDNTCSLNEILQEIQKLEIKEKRLKNKFYKHY